MSKKQSTEQLKRTEEAIRKGYEKVNSSKPTDRDLEKLSDKQLRALYKAGSSSRLSKRDWYLVMCFTILFLPMVVFATYLSFENSTQNGPLNQRAKSVSSGSTKAKDSSANSLNSQQSTNPQVTGSPSSKNNAKPYSPSKCTTVTVTPSTEYINASWLYPEESYTSPGINGQKTTCSPDSNGVVLNPSVDSAGLSTRVYTGTKQRPTPPPPPQYTYAEASAMATNNCRFAYNTSAYEPCIAAYMRQFGY